MAAWRHSTNSDHDFRPQEGDSGVYQTMLQTFASQFIGLWRHAVGPTLLPMDFWDSLHFWWSFKRGLHMADVQLPGPSQHIHIQPEKSNEDR